MGRRKLLYQRVPKTPWMSRGGIKVKPRVTGKARGGLPEAKNRKLVTVTVVVVVVIVVVLAATVVASGTSARR